MSLRVNRLTTQTKVRLTEIGLYRPARFVLDRVIDRSRLHEFRRRQRFYKELVAPGDLCFDVGANIGDYAETFLALGARVVAVEPQPDCVKELCARFSSRAPVVVEAVAMGATEGAGDLCLREHTGSTSFLEVWDNREVIGRVSVPIKTLDQLIGKHGRPNYIKIDVEGYEWQVIQGLHMAVDLISFEYRLSPDDCADKLKIIESLRSRSEIEVAVLGEGAEQWTLPWTAPDKFLTYFPQRVPVDAFLGDIFVRRTL